MSLQEVLAIFAGLLAIIGTPVGYMFRQHIKDDEADRTSINAAHAQEVANLKAAHEREITNLKTAHDQATTDLKASHARVVAGLEAVIADLKIRVEAGDVTATRLMEMTFRSVLAGEKAADTAVTALQRGKP